MSRKEIKIDIIIIVVLLSILAIAYHFEKKRIIREADFGVMRIESWESYIRMYAKLDYINEYGLFRNFADEDQEKILEILDAAAENDVQYEASQKYFMDIFYGDFLYSGRLDESYKYDFRWAIGDLCDIDKWLEEGTLYWKNGEIYLVKNVEDGVDYGIKFYFFRPF